MNENSKKIIVLTSTFPKSSNDEVPTFVRDQIVNIKLKYPFLEFIVLAPQIYDGNKISHSNLYKQIRFHYFWPRKYEKLVGRGIVPSIKEKKLRIFLVPFYFISQIINLILLVKRENPSLIYAHWFTPQAISCYLIYKLYKVPYVFTTHAQDVVILKKIPYIGPYIAKKVINSSKAWSCDSSSTEERLITTIGIQNFKKEKSLVIPMGVDSTAYENEVSIDYKKLDHLNDGFNLLFIGRFAEIKGVEYLINVFSLVNKELPNINLIIAGDGQLKDDYKSLIKKLMIPNEKVIFAGYANKNLKKYLFNISNIVIIPSILSSTGHKEGLPVVLLESLYFGKITMASKYCNAEEIIKDNKNAFLFDPENIQMFKKKILQIYSLDTRSKIEIENQAKLLGKSFTNVNLTDVYYKHLFKNFI